MADPWLTIIGLGEDGPAGLSEASRRALDGAEVIFGSPRHLGLAGVTSRGRHWPVPFEVGPVLQEVGRRVVVLASGDPFWFGAGGSLARALSPGEWVCHPAASTFSLAAARLGWRLAETICLGLHAAPLERLRPVLSPGVRAICLLRDGAAVSALAEWLVAEGFGPSRLTVLEALGGPAERVRIADSAAGVPSDASHPVAVAIEAAGARGLSRCAGLPDALFMHDGQITKAPIRALTLAALAPRAGERLWDLGSGSGSVSVEWCLAAPGARASAVDARADRAETCLNNAARFGMSHRIEIELGAWQDRIADLPAPDAVFVGGGANSASVETILARVSRGTRIVVNAVTLETEALLLALHQRLGGTLMRFEISGIEPLGTMRGWAPARPVVQWKFET